MKKKSFVVIVILLITIILGLCAYIAYDKGLFDSKKESKKETKTAENKDNSKKEVDINSDLVKNLVYPKSNSEMIGLIPSEYIENSEYHQVTNSNFLLKEEYAGAYDLGTKMAASLKESNYPDSMVNCYYYGDYMFSLVQKDSLTAGSCRKVSEEVLKKDLLEVFGPDTGYLAANMKKTYLGYPIFYDSETKSYYGPQGFGMAGWTLSKPILKTYKAEQTDDYLYIYDYALINYVEKNPEDEKITLLFDNYDSYQKYINTNSKEYAKAEVANEDEAQSKLEELIKEKKANTYIWTFKKQSDGKYYYYSSDWQK